MQSLLDWLLTLPLAAVYTVLGIAAAIENLVPPFPSDVVVAFGSFVIAQGGRGTMLGVFLTTWTGNIVGAMLVYTLGRRYGAERLERRLAGKHAQSRDARIRRMFERYGMPAVFVSRFIPGVRAIVPAFAGALKLSVVYTTLMVATASALWYGLITIVAFRVGSDWERLKATITQYGRTAAIVGVVLLAIGVLAWLIARRRQGAK
ncbi:MAG: DedA family protein [Gemmatimonadaceae bacterium]